MAITSSIAAAIAAIKMATFDWLDSAGSPAAAAVSLGFIPSYIEITNITDGIVYKWYDGMTAGHAIRIAANGTITELTSGGFTMEVVPPAAGSGTSVGTNSPGGVLAPNGFTFSTITQNKQYRGVALG